MYLYLIDSITDDTASTIQPHFNNLMGTTIKNHAHKLQSRVSFHAYVTNSETIKI